MEVHHNKKDFISIINGGGDKMLKLIKMSTLVLVLVLSACNSNTPSSEKEDNSGTIPYTNLSTEGQNSEEQLIEEDPLGELEKENGISEDELSTEREIEELKPDMQEDSKGLTPGQQNEETKQQEDLQSEEGIEPESQSKGTVPEIQPEQGAMQAPIPEEPNVTTPPDNTEINVPISTNLSFDNFRERWNAISESQFSNLVIQNLEEVSKNEQEVIYEASLNNIMTLRVSVSNNFVQTLEIESESNTDIQTMLTGWVQVIHMLHPEQEITDVDRFFSEIGVGPNGDLSNVHEGDYPYYSMVYHIDKDQNSYIFKGSYKK